MAADFRNIFTCTFNLVLLIGRMNGTFLTKKSTGPFNSKVHSLLVLIKKMDQLVSDNYIVIPGNEVVSTWNFY